MKKIVSILLCFAAIFALSSCSAEKPIDVYDPDSPAKTQSGENANNNPNAVKITIPEGFTLVKIAWRLEEKGVCSADAFIEAAQNYDISKYSILSSLEGRENLCFQLEGYLFPATYDFEKNTDPVEVLDKMISATQSRFDSAKLERAKELGYSVHEILTVASIIEKETYTDEQRTLVSSTIYNRLNKNMRIEYDVTTKYCTGVIGEQYPDKLDYYKYYYNGYRCDGLIAGPICNPGLACINAALWPDETDYVYFVIDTEEPHHSAFASDYNEHLKNVEKWKNGEL